MIFCVSQTTFISSFVKSPASGKNTSICGKRLKAIGWGSFLGAGSGSPARLARVWSSSSCMACAPAPEAAW